MRKGMLIAIGAFAFGLATVVVLPAQVLVRMQAPTDRAAAFTLAEIEDKGAAFVFVAVIREMDVDQRATIRLLEGGSYNVNIRRLRGPEAALMHPRTTDVYVVKEGSGTLVTGGQMVDADGQPTDAQRGAAIRGGTEQVINPGDLVFIPAGVPHRFRETDGITWFNIRFDTQ